MIDWNDPENCRQLCELTHQYVHGMVYKIIRNHEETEAILTLYKSPNLTKHKDHTKLSIPQLYEHFLNHAQNKSNGRGAIRAVFGSSWGSDTDKIKWETLRDFLEGFKPEHIKTFNGRDHFKACVEDRFKPQEMGKHVKNYITSIYQLGNWLAKFENNHMSFYEKLENIYKEENGAEKLYKELKSYKDEVDKVPVFFGMKELLRDALKELGFTKFVKADVHVDYVAKKLNLVTSGNIADDVAKIAENAKDKDWTPYRLDKLFFLIGSGDIHDDKRKDIAEYYGRRDSIARKDDFLEYVLERLGNSTVNIGDKIVLLATQSPNLRRGAVGTISNFAYGLYDVEFIDKNGELIQSNALYPTEFMILRGKF